MKKLATTLLVAAMVLTGGVVADDDREHRHKRHGFHAEHATYEYARVVDVRPLYRRVKVTTPIHECWDEPVYHSDHRGHKSAGGMLAGGLIGGIVGHQFGKGRGNKVATAVGTLIGAKIGHDAVNGDHAAAKPELVGYEEHCATRHRVSFEEVIDGYDVTYKYRGRRYHVDMPYDPGKRIKIRVEFTPVI